MADWFDIEKVLAEKTLEQQSDETLREFSLVEPRPSDNPAYHHRFDNAQRIIREVLDRRMALREGGNKNRDDKWHKKPIGIIILSVSGGISLLILKTIFGL